MSDDIEDPNFPVLVGEYDSDDHLLYTSTKLDGDYVTVHIPSVTDNTQPRCGETLTSEEAEWIAIRVHRLQTEEMPEYPWREAGTVYRLCSRCLSILDKPPRLRPL